MEGPCVKLLVVGDGNVGKTSLLLRYAKGVFSPEVSPTLFDKYRVSVRVNRSDSVEVTLWDTAGQENYKSVRCLAYGGSDVILLAYSLTSEASLKNLLDVWLPEVRQHCPEARVLLVGTKGDKVGPMEKSRCASAAEKMVSTCGAAGHYACSSLTGENVKQVFDAAIVQACRKRAAEEEDDADSESPKVARPTAVAVVQRKQDVKPASVSSRPGVQSVAKALSSAPAPVRSAVRTANVVASPVLVTTVASTEPCCPFCNLTAEEAGIKLTVDQFTMHVPLCEAVQANPKTRSVVDKLAEFTCRPLFEVVLVVAHGFREDRDETEEIGRLSATLMGGIHLPTWLAKRKEPQFDCPVCASRFALGDMYTVSCLAAHRLCLECAKDYVTTHLNDGASRIRCPSGGDCAYVFMPGDIVELFGRGSKESMQFETLQLRACLAADPKMIKCPGVDCEAFLEVPTMKDAVCCPCTSCKLSFCSVCRAAYHYRSSCFHAREVIQAWLKWLESGRTNYRAQMEQQEHDYQAQVMQLEHRNREMLQRHKEFLQTEAWMEQVCRLCPRCHRPIQKLEGCDLMTCGKDYHGGNTQNGCGQTFNWTQAVPYRADGTQAKTVAAPPPPPVTRFAHPWTCDRCHEQVRGLRFECLNCPCHNLCENCEWRGDHDVGHSFRIIEAQQEEQE